MKNKMIAWAFTGAGHKLDDCVNILARIKEADIFLSQAAEEVLTAYRLFPSINSGGKNIYRSTKASAPAVGRFFSGKYAALIIAPATSNSVAKFVCGISDTLVTNLFAQAGKARIPIIVFPTDLSGEVDSIGPDRELVRIYPRKVDVENARRLSEFAGVEVVSSCEELEQQIAALSS
jgi:dihydromethanopterin reductase (acceptor)